jgi:large subunit ribosomal protein L13
MPAAAIHNRPTYQAKGGFPHSWHVADVDGQTLGRAATKIADILRGKHKPTYTAHEDAGDFVVVINAGKVHLSGKKWAGKLYRDHSLFPGGLRTQTAEQLVKRHPTDLVKRAVWGMLPKGPLGRRIYKKLKVYAGAAHPHAAQEPKPIKFPPRAAAKGSATNA